MNSVVEMNKKLKSLDDINKVFPDEETCIKYLEEIFWEGKPVSPFDPTSKVYKCKNGKYKCKNTGKYFTVKTGTIFEDTKLKLQKWFNIMWFDATQKGSLSSMQLMRITGHTQKTTWIILHKLREWLLKKNRMNLASCKARLNTTNDAGAFGFSNSNTYWCTAYSLGSFNSGVSTEGILFKYTFEYLGDNKRPSFNSNLNYVGEEIPSSYNPPSIETNVINIGYDPRDSENQKAPNVYFKELIIYQD